MPGGLRSVFGSVKSKFSKSSSSSQDKISSTKNSPFSRKETATLPDSAPPPYSETGASSANVPVVSISQCSPTRREASPAPSRASRTSVLTAQSLSTPEDPYAYLTHFDTIFLIDDSGSMAGSRWEEAQQVVSMIAPICTDHDEDGIDLYFLNNEGPAQDSGFHNITSAEQVEKIFKKVKPWGMTPTGTCIEQILQPYIDRFAKRLREQGRDRDPEDTGMKPINLIVITDGGPNDSPHSNLPVNVIPRLATQLDKLDAPLHQVGIQFFQIGNDASAKAALQHLDDNLCGKNGESIRDMVDTVSWDSNKRGGKSLTAHGILKTVLGGVQRRLDRQNLNNGRHLAA